ncbi:hypothetical protein VTI74DRAFT_1079 [Chaetomium olivicolor]
MSRLTAGPEGAGIGGTTGGTVRHSPTPSVALCSCSLAARLPPFHLQISNFQLRTLPAISITERASNQQHPSTTPITSHPQPHYGGRAKEAARAAHGRRHGVAKRAAPSHRPQGVPLLPGGHMPA